MTVVKVRWSQQHYFVVHCRGINFVLSALAFNIIPTVFEVGLVTGILVCACHLAAADLFTLSVQSLSAARVFVFCIMYALHDLSLRIWLTKCRLPVVEHPYQCEL